MNLSHQELTNLPGLDDREMDRLIALRAACNITGAPSEFGDIDLFVWEFRGWLKESKGDSDKLFRRYVLLQVTHERRGVSDREVKALRKLLQDVYSKI